MFKSLKRVFANDLYVQVWERRLKIYSIHSQKVFDEEPLLAIKNNAKGQPVIVAVGNSVKTLSQAERDKIVNPFVHQKFLSEEFAVAQKILMYGFQELSKNNFFTVSPRVIFHPMEKNRADVSDAQKCKYRELCLAAGAREVKLYFGSEISTYNLGFDGFISD